MQAAWQVTGEPKKDKAAGRRHGEARLRAVRSLARVPREAAAFYPYLNDVAGDDQARRHARRKPKTLADEFQDAAARRGVRAAGDQGRERHHPAKALPGTKKKEPANLPNEFVTNDDFCPGLRARAEEHADRAQQPLDRRVPARPQDATRSGAGQDAASRACCASAAGGSSGSSAPIAARSSRRCATTSRRCEKALPPKYAYVHGVRDVEKPVNLKVSLRGNPYKPRRRGAARLPVGA